MPVTDLAKQAVNFCKDNDLPTIYRAVKSTDAHPLVQFVKYGICGVIATVATQGVWFICIHTIFPAVDGMVVDGEVIDKTLRAKNSTYSNIIGWSFGNLVAYFTNLAFVFKGGRHSKWKEFFYFTGVSLFATVVGLAAGPLLIEKFGIHTYVSQLSLLVTAVFVNYACRKFLIFKS